MLTFFKFFKIGHNFHSGLQFVLLKCNFGLISLIVWKLCAFRQRSNFGNLQHFFHHNFWLKRKFWIILVSLEISSSNLSEYTLFKIKKLFFLSIKSIYSWKMKKRTVLFTVFYCEILPMFSDFVNSDYWIRKNTSKSIRLLPVFIKKKDLKLIKTDVF